MQAKLAIAICCLLAAVQARPKIESSTCAPSCAPRTQWTGYKPGSTYKYQFQHEVEVSSDLSQGQKSRMMLSGLATIEMHSPCEMVLSVDVEQSKAAGSSDSTTLNPRETPEQLRTALRQPLRFSNENGKITHLCPSNGETRTSLNIKRGLLSQLQVSVEGRGQSGTVKERDILGECWTEYSTQGRDTLLKVKDFANCKLGYRAYPHGSITTINNDKTQIASSISQGSLECRMELHPSKDFIQQTICEEKHQYPIEDNSKSMNERVVVKTKLSFKEEGPRSGSELEEVKERTGLQHVHLSNEECRGDEYWRGQSGIHMGAECGERKVPETGSGSSHHKEESKKVLEEICSTIRTQKFERNTAQKYSDLIKYLRGITTYDDVSDLYKWATETSECKSQSFFTTIVKSAIGATGTKEMMKLAVEQFTSDQESNNQWLSSVLWNTKNPTSEMLEPIMQYFRSKSWDSTSMTKYADHWYSLGDLTYKICLENVNCESDPNVKAVIDFVSDKFESVCNSPKSESESDAISSDRVVIATIGNLGRVRGGISTVIQCALKTKVPLPSRLDIVSSLRRFSKWSSDEITMLTQLLTQKDLPSEMRIIAYQVLAKFSLTPRSQLIEKIQTILDDSKESEQVQYYIYTYLKNLKGSQKTLVQQLIRKPSIVSRMSKLNRMRYSSNTAASFTSRKLGKGVQIDADLVYSKRSVLPRSLNFNMSLLSPLLGRSHNLLDFSLRLNSMEDILVKMFKVLRDDSSPLSSSSQGEVDWNPSEEQMGTRPSREQPRVEFALRKNGATTNLLGVPSKTLVNAPNYLKLGLTAMKIRGAATIRDAFSKILGGMTPLNKVGTLSDETLSIPTIAGLPILMKKEAHYLVSASVQNPELKSSSKFSLNWEVKPNAVVQISRVFGVDAVFHRAGIETKSQLLTSAGFKLSVKGNLTSKSDLGLSFGFESLQKQEIVDLKTEVNFFQHDSQETTKTPMQIDSSLMTEKEMPGLPTTTYFGHKLNVKAKYMTAKGVFGSVFSVPSKCLVSIEKMPDFGVYEAGFRLVNKADEKTFEVVLGDRNSVEVEGIPKYLSKLLVQYTNKDSNLAFKFDFLNRIWPVQLHWNMRSSSASQYDLNVNYRLLSTTGRGVGKVEIPAGQPINADFTMNFQQPNGEMKRYQVQLQHKFDGWYYFVPLTDCKLTLIYPDTSKLELGHTLQLTESKYNWQMFAIVHKDSQKRTILSSRIQGAHKEEGQKVTKVFLYDFEYGASLTHSCHAKLKMEPLADQTTKAVLSIDHALKVDGKHLPVSAGARLNLVVKNPSGVKVEANGDLTLTTYTKENTRQQHRFTDVVVVMGEMSLDPSLQTGVSSAQGFSLSFTSPQSDKFRFSLTTLPFSDWTPKMQHLSFEAEKLSTANPEKNYQAMILHSFNYNQVQMSQKIKLWLDDLVRFDLTHSLTQSSTDGVIHSLMISLPKVMEPFKLVSKHKLDLSDGCKQTTEIEYGTKKYTHEMETKWGEDTRNKMIEFITYALNTNNPRGSIERLYQLLKVLSFTNVQRYSIVHRPYTLECKTLVNLPQINGEVFQVSLEKTEPKEGLPVGVKITRQISETGSTVALDWSLYDKEGKTQLSLYGAAPMTIKVESKDSKNWHNIEASVESVLRIRSNSLKELKSEGQVKGTVAQFSIDHKIKVEYDSSKQEYKIDASSPESKFALEMEVNPDEKKFKLNSKFKGFVPYITEKFQYLLKLNLQKKSTEYSFHHELMTKKNDAQLLHYLIKVQKLEAQAKVTYKNFNVLDMKAFKLSEPKEIEGVPHGPVDMGLVITVPQYSFYAVKKPEGSSGQSWKFDLTINSNSLLKVSVSINNNELKTGEIHLPGQNLKIRLMSSEQLGVYLPSDSTTPKYVLKWTKNFESLSKFEYKVELESDGNSYVGHFKMDKPDIQFKYQYGKKELPNSLDFSLKLATNVLNSQLKISHVVNTDSRMVIVLPEVELPIGYAFDISLHLPFVLKVKINGVGELQSRPTASGHEISAKTEKPILDLKPIEINVNMKNEGQLTVSTKYDTYEVSGDLKVNKFQYRSLNFDIETSVSTKGIQAFRQLKANLKSELKLDGSRYDFGGEFKSQVNSNDWQNLKISVNGESASVPVKLELVCTGHVDSQLKYGLDDTEGLKIQWQMSKFVSVRRSYNLVIEVKPLQPSSQIRDFKVSLESPKRHYLVSKTSQQTPIMTSTVEVYLNKRMQHGISLKYDLENTSDQWEMTHELQLPTRTLKLYNKVYSESSKTILNTKFSWDKTDESKAIEVTIKGNENIDFSSDVKIEFECKAPFLNNPELYQFELKHLTQGGKVELKRLTSGGVFSIIGQYTNDGSQKMLKLSTVGTKDEHKSQVTMQIFESVDSMLKVLVKFSLPSVERSFKLKYQPMKELTLVCNRGTYLSIVRHVDQVKSKLTLRVSTGTGIATELSVSLNRQKSQIKTKLSSGSLTVESDSVRPIYLQSKSLVWAKAGVTQDSQRIYVAIYTGLKDQKERSVLKASDENLDGGYLVAGLKLVNPISLYYYVEYKDLQSRSIGSALLSNLRLPSNYMSNPSILTPLKSNIGQYLKENINTGYLVSEIRGIADNDWSQLEAFARKTQESNDYFVGDIVQFISKIKQGIQSIPVYQIYSPIEDFTWVKVVDLLKKYSEYINTNTQSMYSSLKSSIPSEFIEFVKKYSQMVSHPLKASKEIMDKLSSGFQSYVLKDIGAFGTAAENIKAFAKYLQDSRSNYYSSVSYSSKEIMEFFFGNEVRSSSSVSTGGRSSGSYKSMNLGTLVTMVKDSLAIRSYNWEISEGSALINGSLQSPVYMQSLDPLTWQSRYELVQGVLSSLKSLWKKVFTVSYDIVTLLQSKTSSDSSIWGPMQRLLGVPHKTIVVQGGKNIVTFDGMTISHSRPCSYVLAHEFQQGKFSVFQTYKKVGGQVVRDQLKVRIGSIKASIGSNGELKVNGEVKSLPLISSSYGSNRIEAYTEDETIVVRFHDLVRNALVIRSTPSSDSVVVQVHPLYIGRVSGMGGSMDGRRSNDIYKSPEEHMRLWTRGECVEEGSVNVSDSQDDELTDDTTTDCSQWFKDRDSTFRDCFDAVYPKPFFTMCNGYTTTREKCQVARLYVNLCNSKSRNIDMPSGTCDGQFP